LLNELVAIEPEFGLFSYVYGSKFTSPGIEILKNVPMDTLKMRNIEITENG
jgi:hypothetical protein